MPLWRLPLAGKISLNHKRNHCIIWNLLGTSFIFLFCFIFLAFHYFKSKKWSVLWLKQIVSVTTVTKKTRPGSDSPHPCCTPLHPSPPRPCVISYLAFFVFVVVFVFVFFVFYLFSYFLYLCLYLYFFVLVFVFVFLVFVFLLVFVSCLHPCCTLLHQSSFFVQFFLFFSFSFLFMMKCIFFFVADAIHLIHPRSYKVRIQFCVAESYLHAWSIFPKNEKGFRMYLVAPPSPFLNGGQHCFWKKSFQHPLFLCLQSTVGLLQSNFLAC